jgi:2-polyprenyl-3-methyl-5-hydroxy-6-metoxy-1,4-benzoquinol methylase
MGDREHGRDDAVAANRRAWEDWARVDPLWAVVTAPGQQNGQWDTEEFFASGRETIDSLWSQSRSCGLPVAHRRALDFGCGVGRLSRALGAHVDHVLGLDISASMIASAKDHNAAYANLDFAVHSDVDLAAFEAGSFDVVCSLLVLQHIPSVVMIEAYLVELTMVLAPGGVMMLGLPSRVSEPARPSDLRSRLRVRSRLAHAMRRVGFSPSFLYNHMNWRPEMPMNAVSLDRMTALLEENGGQVVWSSIYRPTPEVDECLYLITR